MNSARVFLASSFVILCIASMVTLAVVSDRLSAGVQLFLYATVISSFLFALATSCYQTLEPGEVLIVFGRDGKPTVRRGGALIFPVITQVSRLRLFPLWIEFPKESTSDGGIPLNRENRLITKDGLPVTTLARVQIAAAGDDASIIKIIESFGQKGETEVKDHFTKLLGGTVAKVIAEMNSEDLHNHHQTFEVRVQELLQFDAFGYRNTSPVTIGPVTQLSITDARLEGGDATRAQAVLDILKKQEDIRKIEHTNEVSAAQAASDNAQIQRDISKKQEEEKKEKIEHDNKKTKAINAAEFAVLTVKGEEDEEKRRIQKDEVIKRAGLERDKTLSSLQINKLLQDTKISDEEHNFRMAAATAKKKEDVLSAEADSAVRSIQMKLKKEEMQSAIQLRGEELSQNIRNQEGDFEYQLKKLVLKAATDLSRDSATAVATALSKANVTLIGDPAAAAQLASEQVKALGLGVRGKEILALLQDVRFHDAIAGIIGAFRSGPTASQPSASISVERNTKADGADGHEDRTFEP